MAAYGAAVIASVALAMTVGHLHWPAWWRNVAILAAGAAGAAAAMIVAWKETGPIPKFDDVFGRSLVAVTRHEMRARRQTGRAMVWRVPAGDTTPAFVRDAFDKLLGVYACVSADADRLLWFAAERDWWGWPDPPRYVVLGFDAVGKIRAAVDLDVWPAAWNDPDGMMRSVAEHAAIGAGPSHKVSEE